MHTLCLILLLAAPTNAVPDDWPQELAPLAPALDDADQFINRLRAFEKVQLSLARADIEDATRLEEAGREGESQAKTADAQERLDLVRRGYEIGIKQFMRDPRLHNYYGELLYDYYKEHAAALKAWNLALVMDDEFADAHNNLGIHHMHVGNYATGLEHLEAAIDIDGDNPDYLYNLVQSYLIHTPQISELRGWSEKRIYKEAMKMSRKAARLDPRDFELLQDYAVNFFAAERFDVRPDWKEAAEAWQAAREQAKTAPDLFYTWLNEARVWITKGDDERAEPCLVEALKIVPDSDVAQKLLGEARGRLMATGRD